MVKYSRKISFRERFNISRLAIKYSWLTICFWLAVTVTGLFAFSSLKYALFPDVSFPVVVVNATAPLETTLATEAQLTKPIETPLQEIEGIDGLYSSTYSGQTVVNVLFQAGTSLESSTEKVKTVLGKLSLPSESSFEVIPFNLNESTAISYAIASDHHSLKELIKIAKEQIIPSIEQLPGVLRVNLLGDASPPPQENNLLSGANLPTLVRFNAENALAFEVIKRSDANTLEVVSKVEKTAQKLQAKLPEVRLTLAETQADFINEATQGTIDDLILAIVLAVLIIFPFLRNFQATIITAIAIPISLLGTCIVMAIFGFNLETITLLALALTIGIVVDDAIVDVENITRHIENGKKPRHAAILGTKEIGLSVIASTLTIVAVFLPVAFMGGTIGKFFKPFGLTVSAAVLISLLVARTLSPVLAIYWLKPKQKKALKKDKLPIPNFSFNFAQLYCQLLDWSLQHRKIVVGLAIVSFVAGIALIPFIPTGFIPQLDRGEFNIVYTTPLPKLPSRAKLSPKKETTTQSSKPSSLDWLNNLAKSPTRILLRKTRRVGEKLEKVVLESPEVQSVYTIAGVRGVPNKGKMYVKLKGDRQLHTAQIADRIRASLPQLSGVTVSVESIKFVDTGDEKPLKLSLQSNDLQVLHQTAQKVKNRIEKLPGFVDVSASGGDRSDDIAVIERKNSERTAYVGANLTQGKALGDATEQVVRLTQSILPAGVKLDLEGDSARIGEILGDFALTLGLSITCILLLLLFLFGRPLEPLAIGLSVPLSIVGAMLALLFTQSDFGMISLIGLIFLLGLVEKNAILLIDYTNLLRKSGLSRTEAILATGSARLRPILMTTASTILGMLPIALGLGAGSELRQPMAVAIIGGLLTSSILSLIVVPVIYTLLEDWWSTLFDRNKTLTSSRR
ncbi:MAG: efflux RND transporter permease subunit [Prochloraceae cyanobacterium]